VNLTCGFCVVAKRLPRAADSGVSGTLYPYDRFYLDMDTRLDLTAAGRPGRPPGLPGVADRAIRSG
jgi:hypothetical protein